MILKPQSHGVQDYTVFTYDDFQSGQKNPPYPGIPSGPPLFFSAAPNDIVSIREDRYKLAEYYDTTNVPPLLSQWEMYDLLKDPLETENLADTGFQQNNQQQKEYERLQSELQLVKATRLQPLS